MIPDGSVLTQRQLNRALLARQHLLGRGKMPVRQMLEHLVGMQSQVPNDPYIALWTRLAGFTPDELSRMMLHRTAVRASLMRGTIHLVTADDYLSLQPVMQALHERVYPSTDSGRKIDPAAIPEIVEAGQELLAEGPMTIRSVGGRLSDRWPERDRNGMAQAIRFLLPLVQVTPRGVWGQSQGATWALAEEWIGRPVGTCSDPGEMVLRYLRAFGPATVADIQAWSGLVGLRPEVSRLRPGLRTFRNERGQELFDVPDGLLPDPATPAPVRFLPGFDNVLLSHKDRTRIITEDRRIAIGSRNGLFHSTYLVDGVVAGTWKVDREKERATLILRPFERHAPDDIQALEEEGDGLLAFITGADDRGIRFESTG